MIDIRGAKAQAQETDPADRYVLKDGEKKSKTPAIVTMFLLGVALYLKSVFPSLTEAVEGKRPADGEPEGEPEPGMAQTASLDRPALDPEPTGGTATEGDSPRGSGGGNVELLPPATFTRIESPVVGYFQPEVTVDWTGFKAPPAIGARTARAANDNPGGGTIPGGDFPPVTDGPGDGDTDPGGNGPGDTDPGDTDSGGNGPCGGCPDEDPCDDDEDPQSGNRTPRVAGPVYLMDVSGCAILAIGLTDLLRNAVDPDGDTLSVRNLTVSSGTLTQSGDGWVFQGGPQLLGPVTITYEITDGEFTVSQTAHFSVVKSYIGGTGGDDTLLGTMCADDIDGGDGDDNIDGRAGNDVIAGGRGDDHIVAGSGNDTVFGGAGNDIVFGGAGNDHISGGAGNDRLFGDDGDDVIFGDAGDDLLRGGEGDDLLSGGAGRDILKGDAGDDVLDGGDGNDELHGGTGNDVLVDGSGEDAVYGGSGDDHLIAALDGSDDVYDGGEGCDTIDYSASTQGVSIDLEEGIAFGAETGTDTISGFEAASGGSGDDEITGNSGNNVLSGNGGDDRIDGQCGHDVISGGDGNDLLIDGSGEDVVSGGSGDDYLIAALDGDNDIYDGGEGCDTLDYSGTSEGVTVNLVSGTACGLEIGDDAISGFETVQGGSGDDHFVAGGEAAVFIGGDGENTFEFVPADAPSPSPVIHEIMDFKAGDRIRISKYDIFEKICDEFEDRFEDIYGDGFDDDEVAIRYRNDRTDEVDRTIIEADLNNDDIYETTITLNGNHILVMVEHA